MHCVLPSDLPAELVQLVVDFLCGEYQQVFPDTQEVSSQNHSPLTLTKRQLGTCALVCRHWAVHLRGRLFEELTLRSRDDAQILFAYATHEAYNERLRVGPFVLCLSLSVDLTVQPWAHLVYMGRALFPNLSDDCIRLSIRGPTAHSSIHYALPRTLPAAFSMTNGLLIEDVSFANPTHLVSLIRSVHNPPFLDATPPCYLGRLPAGFYRLRNVTFAQHPAGSDGLQNGADVPLVRLWVDYHGTLDLYFDSCLQPWTFLRPFVTTRPPEVIPASSVPKYAWVPCVRAQELPLVEDLLRSLMLHNCSCPYDAKADQSAYGHDVFHIEVSNQIGHRYHQGRYIEGYRIALACGCLGACWRVASLLMASHGLVTEFRIEVEKYMEFRLGSWEAIDASVAAFGPELLVVVVQFDHSIARWARWKMAKTVSESMPQARAAGKLRFILLMLDKRPAYFIDYTIESEEELAGWEESICVSKQPKPLKTRPEPHFRFM